LAGERDTLRIPAHTLGCVLQDRESGICMLVSLEVERRYHEEAEYYADQNLARAVAKYRADAAELEALRTWKAELLAEAVKQAQREPVGPMVIQGDKMLVPMDRYQDRTRELWLAHGAIAALTSELRAARQAAEDAVLKVAEAKARLQGPPR
jgi:hypothetical protein